MTNSKYQYNQDMSTILKKMATSQFYASMTPPSKSKPPSSSLKKSRKSLSKSLAARISQQPRHFSATLPSHRYSSSNSYKHSHIQTFFNNNKDIDKKDELVRKLQNLQQAVNDNILKVMQREQKVEMLVKKAERNDTIAMDLKKQVCLLLSVGDQAQEAGFLVEE